MHRTLSVYDTNKARLLQKVVYTLILLCVFACACFPCNSDRSILATDIHNFFAYALVLLMVLSFVLLLFFSRNKAQKVYALGTVFFRSILYQRLCI